MSQLQKKFIANNAVDDTKIKLTNNANLKARNAADSADVNILKVNASDRIEFASVPQTTSDASVGNDVPRFSQVTPKVTGPGSATDNAIARFDNTTGKLIQNSTVLMDDSGNTTGQGSITAKTGQDFDIKTSDESNDPLNLSTGSYGGAGNTANLSAFSGAVNGAAAGNTSGNVNVGTGDVADNTTVAFAFFTGQVAGMTTDVTITADVNGAAGNGIFLGFNGVASIAVAVAAWNTDNPTNTATVTDGDDSQVPNNGTSIQLSGNDSAGKTGSVTISTGNSNNTGLGQTGDINFNIGGTDGSVPAGRINLNARADNSRLGNQPSGSVDLAISTTKYVNDKFAAVADGLKPKRAVAIATNSNINLASASDPGPIDSYTLQNGDRILLWGQTSAAENGIYDAVTATNPTTWTRSSDFDTSSEIPGSYTVSEFGTTAQGVLYVCLSAPATVGTDPINFAIRTISVTTYTGGDMITLTGSAFSVDLASTSGLESSNPGNAAGQLRVKLEASNPSLQIDGSNQLGAKLDAAGAIVKGAGGLAVQLESSNPTLQISSDRLGVKLDPAGAIATGASGVATQVDNSTIEINTNALRVKDAGITLAKMASNSVDENKIVSTTFNSAGALNGGSGTKVAVRVDAATTKINGSNNLESLKSREEKITLSGTDITNQYVDLAHAIYGTDAANNSASLFVVGGLMQEKAVDYTVSLTGGSGGVTRITFAGDLATGGNAALIAGDKLVINYGFLT